MFDLTRSKQEIKNEVKIHFIKIFNLLIIPFVFTLILILLGVHDGLISSSSSNGTSLLNLLIEPIIATFTLLGISYSRFPKTYLDKKHSYLPGLNSFGDYCDVFLLSLIKNIFIMLWTFLLIVPGIIKSYSYSQSIYIFLDAKHSGHKISYLDAITKSRNLMDGNKWNYFLLGLSFFGWGLGETLMLYVAVLSFGAAYSGTSIVNWLFFAIGIIFTIIGAILLVYVVLYMNFTNASYYTYLADKDDDVESKAKESKTSDLFN